MKGLNKSDLLRLTIILTLLTACSVQPDKEPVRYSSPEHLYPDLFVAVQSDTTLFKDSKTFVDCIPRYKVSAIREAYDNFEPGPEYSLKDFVYAHFIVPGAQAVYASDSIPINEHIRMLWNVLRRPADTLSSGSLIPLPCPYIVPGGRFREIYYWDSYFTMLGLQQDEAYETIQHMVDNFSWLIDEFGYIPNGNRTYYLGRSQPPFYSLMVDLLAEIKGDSIRIVYQDKLEAEYAFWMQGKDKLSDSLTAVFRTVQMPDGEILNRYWDGNTTPRPESYREDVRTARKAAEMIQGIRKEEVYRNLRAAAESGWDFSSRWLEPGKDSSFHLHTIHTTEIVPVDLNSLLFHIEKKLAEGFALQADSVNYHHYKKKANLRKQAILKYCWDEEAGFYTDYNYLDQETTGVLSLAGVYPLYFGIADDEKASLVVKKLKSKFLKDGGLVTTPHDTGQQWDAPNGWAPLQWMSITGLRNYGHAALADTVKSRWLALNRKVYNETFKLTEKYNVVDLTLESGGGEYPTQDGFGWTNGVYQRLSAE